MKASEFDAKGFVGHYLAWASRCSSAPGIFHVGAALAALSAIFAPRTRLAGPRGEKLQLALWIGLVGPPSARKSTAITLARSVIPLDLVLPWTDAQRRSSERTFKFFAAYPQGLVLEDDWGHVLRRIRSWGAPGASLLVGLRDGETMRRVAIGRRRGMTVDETRIASPCISLLTGFSGGGMSGPLRPLADRMLWLTAPCQRAGRPRPDVAGTGRLAWHLARLRGALYFDGLSVTLDRGAIRAWKTWMKALLVLPSGASLRLSGLLLRAAALVALGDDRTTVDAGCMDLVLRTVGAAGVAGAKAAAGE